MYLIVGLGNPDAEYDNTRHNMGFNAINGISKKYNIKIKSVSWRRNIDMIRFRNPGTQYTTQVQVFKELYKEYKDAPSFDLDDMASTITKTKLMTAYGYAGDAALALSNTENDTSMMCFINFTMKQTE